MGDLEAVEIVQKSALLVLNYQPGNGSRYDLVVAPRPHGGQLVIWEAAELAAIVYAGSSAAGGLAELRPIGKRWPIPDRQAVAELLGEIYRRGMLP